MPPTDDTMWTEDRAARELLTFPRVVASILTELLPEAAAFFDFDKMQIRPTVTLDSSGKERIADSSWEIALKTGQVVGIPIEWQSTPNSNMLWRMIEYATRLAALMSRQSRLGHPEGSTPYVFPIVIYTGGPRGTWNAPTEWRHQPADQPDQFPPRHLAFGYPLICADDAKDYAGDNPRTARTLMTIAGTGETATTMACRRLLRRLEGEGDDSLDLVAAVLRFFKVIVVKRWPDSEIAKRLAHINTWRDVRSISTEQKRMELEMTLTTFEREIAELEARGVAKGRELGMTEGHRLGVTEGRKLGVTEGHKLGVTEGHKLGVTEGHKLGMTDSIRRLLKRKYGQSAWEKVSAIMNSAPSFSVTAEMFDWLLECSSADEFLAKLKADNGVTRS